MKLKKNMALALMLCAFAAGRAAAADIDFNFEIPTIPYPPKIEDVSNSSAVSGSFTVTASITGQMQMKGFCDIEPREDCTAADWYQAADPEVSPNPPTIQKVKLYYYKNDNVSGAASVDMVYDAGLAKFKADVPLAGVVQGDTMTTYIVAIDSRGNVASQVPDTGQRPCPSTSSWDASLATPATNSCSYATSYTRCNQYVPGTPAPCSSAYTMGDPNGDVCGEPDAGGVQHLISGVQADKVDILGISAGADNTYVCVNMGLKAPTPPSSDPPPIECYIAIFFNPDIYDPNPGDTHIENAFAITYCPEAVGSDPTLVKVLWSGDCVTDPNTANPLDCKLISAVGASDNLKIEYGGGSLKYMVKKSGTGNPLVVPFNILGNTTKQAIIIGLTGEINLSGGTAFWISDLTPGFAFYQRNKPVDPCLGCDWPPSCPLIISTRCSVDGTGGTSSECYKSVSQPAQNKCRVNFNRSGDYSFINEYRIYRNTTASTTGAVKISAVAENGSATYSYLDTLTLLDGKTYYYFITSYNATADQETPLSDSCRFSCTVEDWVAPEKPVITAAATPPGNEKKCKIDWGITTPDPSLQSFFLSRSDDGGASYTPLNYTNPLGAAPGSLAYTWTDAYAQDLGFTYKYTVTPTDLGWNTNTSDPFDCTPEDRKAPEQISCLATNYGQNLIGAKIECPASGESDFAGYNLYWCRMNNKAIDCRTAASFAKLNTALLESISFSASESTNPAVFSEEGDYCFYVEACDNCATAGTCPGNNGASNCSGFPSGGADSTSMVKCLTLTRVIPLDPPAFPGGLACAAPPEGGKIDVSWNHICIDADGTPFAGYDPASGTCINPDANELVGYKVIFGPSGLVPDYPAATSMNIAGTLGVTGAAPTLAHNRLVNGQEYCYTAYGVDGSGNFSDDSTQFPKQEKCCTPKDIIAPDKPEMGGIDFTSISCTPAWSKVEDKDPITYSIYRCEGTTAQCANRAAFSKITDGISENVPLSYLEYDVTPDQEYQYCVTASDPSGNESPVVETSGNTNCNSCTPSDRPPPVTGVTGAELNPDVNTGVKLFWDKNKQDSGAGGYNVYRCAGSDCAGDDSPIKSCVTTVPASTSPLVINDEPPGYWYYGVTYMKDCADALTESYFDAKANGSISGLIHIEDSVVECGSNKWIKVSSCADYEAKSGCVPVQEIDTSANGEDGKFLVAGVSGYDVFITDANNEMIGSSAKTDDGGNYLIRVCNDGGAVNLSNKYKIVLKVPEASKSGVPCSPGFSGNDCYIALESSVTVADDGVTKKVSGLKLPEPGGGCAEIGNADCTDSVDVGDLLILKGAFGGNLGDSKYKTYADFDGNGRIDVEDFLILRKNFGKTLDAAPTCDAALCKP